MEAKSKSGAAAPKPVSTPKAEKPIEKTGKKEPAPPRKANPAPADPPPEAPAPEKPAEDGATNQDEVADQEAPPEGTDAAETSTEPLAGLKPLIIGGAVIAAAAILVGVFLLARRN